MSEHKYGLGGHGDMAGDTCHEGWGRGLVTLTRVTRGHQSRASNMQSRGTMGILHAAAVCIYSLFSSLITHTRTVHIQNDYDYKHNSRILSTSRPV